MITGILPSLALNLVMAAGPVSTPSSSDQACPVPPDWDQQCRIWCASANGYPDEDRNGACVSGCYSGAQITFRSTNRGPSCEPPTGFDAECRSRNDALGYSDDDDRLSAHLQGCYMGAQIGAGQSRF